MTRVMALRRLSSRSTVGPGRGSRRSLQAAVERPSREEIARPDAPSASPAPGPTYCSTPNVITSRTARFSFARPPTANPVPCPASYRQRLNPLAEETMQPTHWSPLSRHLRALGLTLSFSMVVARSALPQMAPQFTAFSLAASLAASLLRPGAVDSSGAVEIGIASVAVTAVAPAVYPRAELRRARRGPRPALPAAGVLGGGAGAASRAVRGRGAVAAVSVGYPDRRESDL